MKQNNKQKKNNVVIKPSVYLQGLDISPLLWGATAGVYDQLVMSQKGDVPSISSSSQLEQ